MNYQIDFGGGYENVLPDGHGMHEPVPGVVHDDDCESCWSPTDGDPDVWFDAVFQLLEGAERARCGQGGWWQYEYTAEEWARR